MAHVDPAEGSLREQHMSDPYRNDDEIARANRREARDAAGSNTAMIVGILAAAVLLVFAVMMFTGNGSDVAQKGPGSTPPATTGSAAPGGSASAPNPGTTPKSTPAPAPAPAPANR